MEHFLFLPFDLKENIVRYLKKSEILNLACCCKQLEDEMKYFMYYDMKVNLKKVGRIESLKNLKLTKILRIYVDSNSEGYDWSTSKENYYNVIEHCNHRNATEIEINGLDYLTGIPDEEVEKTLNKFINLRNIRLMHCRMNNMALDKVCQRYAGQLTVLDISGNSYRLVNRLENIVKLVNLVKLKITWTAISDEILEAICLNIPKLRCLVIPNCIITEEGLYYLKNLFVLTELNISNNKIHDQGFFYLRNNMNLVSLDVSENECMTDLGTKHLTSQRNLTYLNMSNTKITDEGLSYILELSSLKKLDIDSCCNITDNGIRYIAQLPDLKKASIENCALITPNCLSLFQHMVNVSVHKEGREFELSDDVYSDDTSDYDLYGYGGYDHYDYYLNHLEIDTSSFTDDPFGCYEDESSDGVIDFENCCSTHHDTYPADQKHPPLVLSAQSGDLSKVKKCLDETGILAENLNVSRNWTEVQAKSCSVKSWNWHDDTALIAVSRNGSLDIVKHLLMLGADPTLKSCHTCDEYQTALDAAKAKLQYKKKLMDEIMDGTVSSYFLAKESNPIEAATNILNSVRNMESIVQLITAASSYWKESSYASPHLGSSPNRKELLKKLPNKPTNLKALQNTITKFKATSSIDMKINDLAKAIKNVRAKHKKEKEDAVRDMEKKLSLLSTASTTSHYVRKSGFNNLTNRKSRTNNLICKTEYCNKIAAVACTHQCCARCCGGPCNRHDK